jgi:hypothetical protein
VVGKLEAALAAVVAAEGIRDQLRADPQKRALASGGWATIAAAARVRAALPEPELETLELAARLTREVIAVDDFPQDFGMRPTAES